MIVIIRISPELHTPVYFFLSHVSFQDFCYFSVTTPTLLEILVVDVRTISCVGCMMQFFGCTLVITEVSVLAVMAYDWFVVVCNPLFYTVAVSPELSASWLLEPTRGVERVPWQSHVLFWSCLSVVLTSCITLAVSVLHRLCLLLWLTSVRWHVLSFLLSMRCVASWLFSPPMFS